MSADKGSDAVRKENGPGQNGNNAVAEDNRFELPPGSEQPDVVDKNGDVLGAAAIPVADNAAVVADEQSPASAAAVAVANTSVAEAITVPGDDVEMKLK